MNGGCKACGQSWWVADPVTGECPGCRIATLEAKNKRLEYELRVEKEWVRQYRDAYTRLKGDER